MLFNGNEHKVFYEEHLKNIHHDDNERSAMLYVFGISDTTRQIFTDLYDEKEGRLKEFDLMNSYLSTSEKSTIRLASEMFNGRKPYIDWFEPDKDIGDEEIQNKKDLELERYSVRYIFDTGGSYNCFYIQAMCILCRINIENYVQ